MAPIRFGSLVFKYQSIDTIGPFDLLNSCGKDMLQYMKQHGQVEDFVIDQAPDFVFHHIGKTLDPVSLLTSTITIVPTTTVDTCPELDCLFIPGSIPEGSEFPAEYVEFVRRYAATGKPLFTNCTGASHLASTGVLDGKNATVNNVEYNWVKKHYPKVKWTREKKWVVDGNIWTGSGAVAGMDMIAHWIKENFGLAVLIAGAKSLEYEPRDENGLFNIFSKRYDSSGKQIATHVFA